MESCSSRYFQIGSTVPEKIKGEFNLWHKMVPFFCGKGRISTAKRSNKMNCIGFYGCLFLQCCIQCCDGGYVVEQVGSQFYVSTAGPVKGIRKLYCQGYGPLVDDEKM